MEGTYLHSTYFLFEDRSPELPAYFMGLCVEYLSTTPGIVKFSIGTRDPQQNRPVNDLNFDVAMDIIFESIEAYTAYQNDPDHEGKFVQAVKDINTTRRVFDSYLI